MTKVFICRDMKDMILGVFLKRENAEESFRAAIPIKNATACIFDGIAVKSGAKQLGWLTEHILETETRGDFKRYSNVLG